MPGLTRQQLALEGTQTPPQLPLRLGQARLPQPSPSLRLYQRSWAKLLAVARPPREAIGTPWSGAGETMTGHPMASTVPMSVIQMCSVGNRSAALSLQQPACSFYAEMDVQSQGFLCLSQTCPSRAHCTFACDCIPSPREGPYCALVSEACRRMEYAWHPASESLIPGGNTASSAMAEAGMQCAALHRNVLSCDVRSSGFRVMTWQPVPAEGGMWQS